MLIGLAALLVLLFTMVESPLLLKETDKLVKKHLEDQTRKERMIVLLKEGHEARRTFVKQDAQITKEFNKYYALRESNEDQLIDLVEQYSSARHQMQLVNRRVSMEAQELITDAEWEKIKPGIVKGMKKVGKDLSKDKRKIEKSYIKVYEIYQKEIEDPEKAEKVIAASKNFEKSLYSLLDQHINEINDVESVIYTLRIEEKEMQSIQIEQTQTIENLLKDYVNFHKILVDNVTETEWKEIKGKIKFPI